MTPAERLHAALCGCFRGPTELWDTWAARLTEAELEAEIARAEARR